jgi:pyrroloquinoline quinone biosynthesis protein B
VEGVALTDAEVDHTLGIVLLREGRLLHLYATEPVQSILEQDSRILPVTRAFADTRVIPLTDGQPTPLRYRDDTASGLSVQPFLVAGDPPRFAGDAGPGHTSGFLIRDQATGRACAFVPGCGELTEPLLSSWSEIDLLLFDGTFWSDDELITLGIGDRSARSMDHVPVSGPDGSLIRLGDLTVPRKVYTHINNTNPMLLEDSPERTAVEEAGVMVGMDGMSFIV